MAGVSSFAFLLFVGTFLLFGCCGFMEPQTQEFPAPTIPTAPTTPPATQPEPQPQVQTPTCTPGLQCKDANVLAYQTETCGWTDSITCEFGCVNSACKPDLCKDVVCNDYCEGSTKFYNGKCVNGECTYAGLDCVHGCKDGVCVNDPCKGVVCTDRCEGSTLFYNGACVAGSCTYSINQCEYGCENAKCKNLVCDVVFDKTSICVGESVVGHMYGAPNDICDLYYSANGGAWLRDPVTPTFQLDAQGHYSESRTGAAPGVFEFRANCGKCISDIGLLEIVACPQPPPPQGCDQMCKDRSYAGGYEGQCGKPWLYEGETQVDTCCCYGEVIPAGHRCYDTDLGNTPETFGTCYDEAHPNGIADYCGGPGLGDNWVGENFCSGGQCMGVSELCPTNTHCVNGACVPV